jgi:hypothetical protein
VKEIRLILITLCLIVIPVTACVQRPTYRDDVNSIYQSVDYDLTQLSNTVVYSQVFDMLSNPSKYDGKIFRLQGILTSYKDDETNETYYACIVPDASVCCSEGLEFVIIQGNSYPLPGTEIFVTGVFERNNRNGIETCRLINAEIQKV